MTVGSLFGVGTLEERGVFVGLALSEPEVDIPYEENLFDGLVEDLFGALPVAEMDSPEGQAVLMGCSLLEVGQTGKRGAEVNLADDAFEVDTPRK